MSRPDSSMPNHERAPSSKFYVFFSCQAHFLFVVYKGHMSCGFMDSCLALSVFLPLPAPLDLLLTDFCIIGLASFSDHDFGCL